MKNEINFLPYGLGSPKLIEVQQGYFVDYEIVDDLNKLTSLAKTKGFKIQIESGYRTFEKQLSIWNKKASGELPLLDSNGNVMKKPLDEEELMYAILTWSALPGASRHHLGTDIDVIDANACPKDYEVQLTPAECDGMFVKFHSFLTESFLARTSFGFDRVFIPERGKIKPEKWHIAHLPTSRKRLSDFSLETLRHIYESSNMACKRVILARLDSLAEDYIYPYFI